MDIKLEIFAGAVADAIKQSISHVRVNIGEIVNTNAVLVLEEIRNVIQDTEIEDDFDVVEKIVCIFEKYNIDAGFRHDF